MTGVRVGAGHPRCTNPRPCPVRATPLDAGGANPALDSGADPSTWPLAAHVLDTAAPGAAALGIAPGTRNGHGLHARDVTPS
jgi:hypothetical protein